MEDIRELMKTVPLEIETIIKDYKAQLDLTEKYSKLLKELPKYILYLPIVENNTVVYIEEIRIPYPIELINYLDILLGRRVLNFAIDY